MSIDKLIRVFSQADDVHADYYVEVEDGTLLRVESMEDHGENETLRVLLHLYGGEVLDLDPEEEVRSWMDVE